MLMRQDEQKGPKRHFAVLVFFFSLSVVNCSSMGKTESKSVQVLYRMVPESIKTN